MARLGNEGHTKRSKDGSKLIPKTVMPSSTKRKWFYLLGFLVYSEVLISPSFLTICAVDLCAHFDRNVIGTQHRRRKNKQNNSFI